MFYLLLGGVLLAFILSGRASRFLKGDGWRVGAGALAIVCFAGAGYAGIRQSWEVAIVLLVIGVWTATTARQRPQIRKMAAKSEVGLTEARSILGVGPEASKAEIQAAYARLMRLAHPDKGGTAGLAA